MTHAPKPNTWPTPDTGVDRRLGDLRFRALLGAEAWAKLPAAIRRRFGKRLGAGESVVYRGVIRITRLSRLGRILAGLLTLCGAPLPLAASNGGEVAVATVTETSDGKGQYWSRQYNRHGNFPQIIQSKKRFSGPTGLEELVGGGLGMTLQLRATAKSLTFHSDRYFLTLLGVRIYLPHLLTPGALTVGHHDVGGGAFEFTLDLNHPLFGELAHQRAQFVDMGVGLDVAVGAELT